MNRPFKPKAESKIVTLNRPMPHDEDAEKGVLSCFLHDPELLLRPLNEEWFYSPINREYYTQMRDMRNEGMPVEYILLSKRLADKGRLNALGGQGVLAELLGFIPTPMHFTHYVDILKQSHLARVSILGALGVVESSFAHEREGIEDAAVAGLNLIAEAARSIRKRKDMGEELDEWVDEWEQMAKGEKKSAYPTRWPAWNRQCMGIRSGYSVIMGPRGSGKSVLVQNIFTDACLDHGLAGIYFSFEMKAKMILNRIIADIGAIHGAYLFSPDLNSPTGEDKKRLMATITRCLQRIRASKMEIVHDVRLSPEAVVSKIRSCHAKHGHCIAAIDYLQLLDPPKSKRCDNREQEVAGISALFRAISKELDIPVFALSQVNKDKTSRESNAPEQDADDVYLIDRYKLPDGSTHEGPVNCMKNRNGPDGPINLKFKGELFRFTEPSIADHLP